jgi:3-dehydroquinate synthase
MQVDISFSKRASSDYSIYIDRLDGIKCKSKVAIVTNPKVGGLHLAYLLNKIEANEVYVITLADGEEYKNQQSVDYILENLLNHKFDRDSMLIAFGGGVVGDLTGFVASIYQRGIDFIQIPTTLLSQVDASVGGKTGINTKYGKNLIGSFNQPKVVYIQTSFLTTLPRREFSAGLAEMVKMAVTFDKEFFELLLNIDISNNRDIQVAIQKSIEIKAKVVALDEKESGIRAVLNYGHTFAHVIEQETSYKKFLHGEAVSIGMVMANRLAKYLGLLNDQQESLIREFLNSHNLPTTYLIKDINSFYNIFFLDKKTKNNSLTFILPNGIGDYKIVQGIDKNILLKVLSEFS